MKRYAVTMWVLFAAVVALLVYAGIVGAWLTFGGVVLGWLFGVAVQQYLIAKRIQGAMIQQIAQAPELLAQLLTAQQPKQSEGGATNAFA